MSQVTRTQEQQQQHHHHHHHHHHRFSSTTTAHNQQQQPHRVPRPTTTKTQHSPTQLSTQQQQHHAYTHAQIPTKPGVKELGRAGWTLIHSIASNYPVSPSEKDKFHASAFITSIAHLYPCKRCRRHFERYITASPPDLSSRQSFLIWTCQAHNNVNRSNGKRGFPCQLQTLEHRWGDCGCQRNKKN